MQHVGNIKGYYFSSQRCIMAGHCQTQHPHPCRFLPDRSFDGKFVTDCITGGDKISIHAEAYQVSKHRMTAPVFNGCLVPTYTETRLYYRLKPSPAGCLLQEKVRLLKVKLPTTFGCNSVLTHKNIANESRAAATTLTVIRIYYIVAFFVPPRVYHSFVK